jgi:hypothetical protein
MMDFLLYYFGLFIVSIVFHEFGHYRYALGIKRKAQIVYNGRIQTIVKPGVTKEEELRDLYKSGIFFGSIPIFICFPFFPSYWIVTSFVLLIYIVGCKDDINRLMDLAKDNEIF